MKYSRRFALIVWLTRCYTIVSSELGRTWMYFHTQKDAILEYITFYAGERVFEHILSFSFFLL